MVRQVLKQLLLGLSALDVEALWDEMNTATLPYGRKGLAVMAISGVDLALWDLRGKREGKSVAALLGATPAATTRRLPSYSTAPLDATSAVAEGFTAIKLAVGSFSVLTQRDEIVEVVRRTREAIGPDVRDVPCPKRVNQPPLNQKACWYVVRLS